MRIYHGQTAGQACKRVHGPADLTPKTGGFLIAVGPATEDESVSWAAQIGLFVARGGDVMRRQS